MSAPGDRASFSGGWLDHTEQPARPSVSAWSATSSRRRSQLAPGIDSAADLYDPHRGKGKTA